MKNGKITSDARIIASLPTFKHALENNAAVIIMSHLGKPTEGEYNDELSLEPIAKYLSQALQQEVRLEKNYLNGLSVSPGEVVLCENVRFNKGEKANDDKLARKMADLCDVFVMDAFATAHRDEASTSGISKYASNAVAGPLLLSELSNINKALKSPQKPMIAIVGGSKVSSKLTILNNLIEKVDTLIVGGGIANTFLAARNINIGSSLYEKDLVTDANNILNKALDLGVTIPLPIDVCTAKEFSDTSSATNKPLNAITDDDLILDIGPKTAAAYASMLRSAATILWNGPLGVFEFDNFSHGTETIGKAIATSNAFSIAGGGDTIAALNKFNLSNNISYISTGGGAFLTLLEEKPLPAITQLEQRQTKRKA